MCITVLSFFFFLNVGSTEVLTLNKASTLLIELSL